MLTVLRSELRQCLRGLSRRPLFALLVVATLALGIGANTAVYSVFRQLVIRPLPVPDADALVNLAVPGSKSGSTSSNTAGEQEAVFSYPMYADLARRQTGFTGLAAHRSFTVNLASGSRTQTGTRTGTGTGSATLVSSNYFDVLGLQPALGRLLGAQDAGPPGAPAVVVLGYDYWRTALGADPGIVGETLRVNGVSLQIVGVGPSGFSGTTNGVQPQVFVPVQLRWLLSPQSRVDHDRRDSYWLYLFARLRPGVTLTQAATQLDGVHRQLLAQVEAPLLQSLDANALAQFIARPLQLAPGAGGQSTLAGQVATPLGLLLAVAALVLLIACLNTANLLLARGAAKLPALAVRASLGAGRSRLLRLQLLEAGLLALGAALAALPLAAVCLRGLVAWMPAQVARAVDPALDLQALGFALLVAFGTILLFGVLPALHTARCAVALSLRQSAGGSGGNRIAGRFRAFLATAQIGLSMSALVMAGLFLQSLLHLSRVPTGMQLDTVASFAVSPARNGYDPARAAAFFDALEQAVRALPGVSAASTSLVPVLSDSNESGNVSVEGFKGSAGQSQVSFNRIGSAYFDTLSVPFLAGRDFTAADVAGRPKVAIVNRRFAEKFGLGQSPTGRRMAIGEQQDLDIEIVGLVEDARYDHVRNAPPPQVFLPRLQLPVNDALVYYVRSALPPEALLGTLAQTVARLDPELPVEELGSVHTQIRQTLVIDYFIGALTSAFAVLATLLAALGVYGVLAFALAQRTREIGLRMALGAAPARVRAGLLIQALRLFVVGGAAGLALALLLGHAAQGLLYGLDAHDPGVLVGATVLLALVALAASWFPARRAARIDPLVAMRWDG